MQPAPLTVTQLLDTVNETLGVAFPELVVVGEVSSFKINQGKFVFFDIKDDTATVSCFMMLFALHFPIEDGMTVRLTGTTKITKFSKFSFTVRRVELVGEGQLRRAMEILRAQLARQGLFDEDTKRPLPLFPARIGLITSATSAAYSDFVAIAAARWGGLTIELAGITVQGQSAPQQIAAAIQHFSQSRPAVDVVVLIRGGGSLDDLSAFSTEPVVRAVAASRVPIVVGVGHENDYSLADLAADVRAATPTDAARLVVPDRVELSARVDYAVRDLAAAAGNLVTSRNTRIDRQLHLMDRAARVPSELVAACELALVRGLDRCAATALRFEAAAASLHSRLDAGQNSVLTERRYRLEAVRRLLASADPKALLRRGYAIVTRDGRIVKDARLAGTGDRLVIQLAQGTLHAEVRPGGHEAV